jgi:hypothetical protein
LARGWDLTACPLTSDCDVNGLCPFRSPKLTDGTTRAENQSGQSAFRRARSAAGRQASAATEAPLAHALLRQAERADGPRVAAKQAR